MNRFFNRIKNTDGSVLRNASPQKDGKDLLEQDIKDSNEMNTDKVSSIFSPLSRKELKYIKPGKKDENK